MTAHGHRSPSELAPLNRSSASYHPRPASRRGLSAPRDVPMELPPRAVKHEVASSTQHARAHGVLSGYIPWTWKPILDTMIALHMASTLWPWDSATPLVDPVRCLKSCRLLRPMTTIWVSLAWAIKQPTSATLPIHSPLSWRSWRMKASFPACRGLTLQALHTVSWSRFGRALEKPTARSISTTIWSGSTEFTHILSNTLEDSSWRAEMAGYACLNTYNDILKRALTSSRLKRRIWKPNIWRLWPVSIPTQQCVSISSHWYLSRSCCWPSFRHFNDFKRFSHTTNIATPYANTGFHRLDIALHLSPSWSM